MKLHIDHDITKEKELMASSNVFLETTKIHQQSVNLCWDKQRFTWVLLCSKKFHILIKFPLYHCLWEAFKESSPTGKCRDFL